MVRCVTLCLHLAILLCFASCGVMAGRWNPSDYLESFIKDHRRELEKDVARRYHEEMRKTKHLSRDNEEEEEEEGDGDDDCENEKEEKCIIPRRECPITTTPKKQCVAQRKLDTLRARQWFKITDENSTIAFKFREDVPFLDQTIDTVRFYYALDRDESKYISMLSTWLAALNKIGPKIIDGFKTRPFISNAEYLALHKAFNDAVAALKTPQHFANPTQTAEYTDHFSTGYWKTDDAFAQRRVAGECPFLLKKVLEEGDEGIKYSELSKVLNKNFFENLKIEVSSSKSVSFKEAIEDGILFVHYLEDMNDIETVPDILASVTDPKLKLSKQRSPISFFVIKDDGKLGVVAIQPDPKPDSPVLTPKSDKDSWEIAKGQVDQTSASYCHAKIHLGGIHWVTTVYCLTFRRHLSTRHPLYEFFLHHCDGTIPHISVAYPVTINDNDSTHKFYAMGNKGFRELSKKQFDERSYNKMTYESYIEGQGLDDDRIKYFPFRDDAKVIMDGYDDFADELINKVYGRFRRISRDKELQSWANELSADGKIQPDGGKGKMIDFPARFTSKGQLKTFIKRFMWYNVLHAAVNYALAPDFMPISSAKMYENTNGTPLNYLQSVGGAAWSAGYTLFRGTLSSFRMNRIFDYHRKVTNPRYRDLVRRYYYRFHNCIQKKLAKRNAERKAKNLLGYQFVEPKWMSNSIHI